MKRNFVFILTLFILLAQMSYGQEAIKTKNNEFWHRISVGGYLGASFGDITAISLSPEVMVRVVDQFHLGVGFSYDYLRTKNYFLDSTSNQFYDFKANVYGGRIFARYYLRSLLDNAFGNFFAHVEYEYLYYTIPFVLDPKGTIFDPFFYTYRKGKNVQEISSLLIGVGYEQPITDWAFIDIILLYNINETYNSPYSNPVFRLGFGFRL